jgi:hypothetical protein
MSTKLHTIPELADLLDMSTTQVFNELQSFPHQSLTGADIRFTEADVTEIRAIRAASPTEQLERYQRILDKREQILALRDMDGAEDGEAG